jgi:hypothetical protein
LRNEKVVIGGKKIGRDRETKDDFLAGNRTLSQGLLVGLFVYAVQHGIVRRESVGENVGDKLQIGRAAAAH